MLKQQYKELDNRKAAGIDGITKAEYGKVLEANLKLLLSRIRQGKYQAKPARITAIPKEGVWRETPDFFELLRF